LLSIGYKQALAHIHGECTLAEAIDETAKLTRRYAKRQLTWYRQYSNVLMLDPAENEKEQISCIEKYLAQTANSTNPS